MSETVKDNRGQVYYMNVDIFSKVYAKIEYKDFEGKEVFTYVTGNPSLAGREIPTTNKKEYILWDCIHDKLLTVHFDNLSRMHLSEFPSDKDPDDIILDNFTELDMERFLHVDKVAIDDLRHEFALEQERVVSTYGETVGHELGNVSTRLLHKNLFFSTASHEVPVDTLILFGVRSVEELYSLDLDHARHIWRDQLGQHRNKMLDSHLEEEKEAQEDGDEEGLREIQTIRDILNEIPREVNLKEYIQSVGELITYWPSLLLPAPLFVAFRPNPDRIAGGDQ